MLYIRNLLTSIGKSTFTQRQSSGSGADILGGLGSGAGKGGGGGGTVREAGGGLGKYGAAKEEEYFYKKRNEQLKDLNKRLEMKQKSNFQKRGRKKVEDVIEGNRKRISELNKCFRKKEK